MTREFTLLCLQAAEAGTSIVLEIMPFSNVRTVDVALQVVEGANQPNGGLLLDIRHLSRDAVDFSEMKS